MKIKSIHIRKFKRFDNLTIRGIGEKVKLVVLLGKNGSGKSSVFDALSIASMGRKHDHNYSKISHEYYARSDSENSYVTSFADNVNIQFHDSDLEYPENSNANTKQQKTDFYFRSSYRFEAAVSLEHLKALPPATNDNTDPRAMNNLDTRVADNYQRLAALLLEEVSKRGNDDNVPRIELRDRYIADVKSAMLRVFGNLDLEGLGKPLQNGSFEFSKGTQKNFKYINLSGGEKAAFDILLDFGTKKKDFNNTVYCVDEPELHMNTALEGKLLKEIINLLPDKCQLWIATHSIGMIRTAREMFEANPEEVAFLDFSDKDFDTPQVLEPIQPDRKQWRKVFDVPLGDLNNLIMPKVLCICEGERVHENGCSKQNSEFDAFCYNYIFGKTHPETQFVSVGGCNDVAKWSKAFEGILGNIVSGVAVTAVFDLDDRSTTQVNELKAKGYHVLGERDIENYLWADEIIKIFCSSHNNSQAGDDVVSKKQELLSAQEQTDDVKSISGKIYSELKKRLSLRQCGNDPIAFAKEHLIPLISPDTETYKALENAVFA